MSPLAILTVASRQDRAPAHVLEQLGRAAGAFDHLDLVVVDEPSGTPSRVPLPIEHRLRVLAPSGRALARAMAPWVALGMLDDGRTVALLGPTTWVGAPIEAALDPTATGLTMVPARLSAAPPRPGSPARAFQPSLLAVDERGADFLEWWAEREMDVLLGLMDGNALDEAAASHIHDVTRDAGLGIDAWNAGERAVAHSGRGFTAAGGVPLRTYDFDGFDPTTPHLAVATMGRRPPILLSEEPALRRLYLEYADLVLEAHSPSPELSYAWNDLGGSLRLDAAMRLAYRDAFRSSRLGRGPELPDPYVPGGVRSLVAFLNEPDPASANLYSRYLWALYRSWPGLVNVFPDVLGDDRRHFLHWLHRYARSQGPIPSAIDVPKSATPSPRRSAAHGVNVAGYLSADLGLGVSARRTIAALEQVGVPVHGVTYRRTMSRQRPAAAPEPEDLYDVTIACITAEQFHRFRSDIGEDFFRDRYTIGYWYWELEELPDEQVAALDLVDEVWVATRHVRGAIAARTTKPVLHMPIPLLEPTPSGCTRASLGLTDQYTFLVAFDFLSVMARKNPLGAVDAFVRAFPSPGHARLVLKSINGEQWPEQAELVRCAIADRPDIALIDTYLNEADHAALLAASDCYVSLHRAEGLGLNLADAMALEKPVIATAYSGNLDFMNDANSFLVPFTYTKVPAGTPAYPAGAKWADPDLDVAAAIMRQLVADPALGQLRGRRARADILAGWDLQRTGAKMIARLQEVWRSGRVSRS